ncbi:conserved hypothetical protein [Paraburkholderia unamae]|uniref:hypothetical protein n=1 Tax=Paraburkholderia unamae TaxID=219649 RepID=UPI001CADC2DC|nr:hypothetical protein [Paraburkholderia unamae]CAG9268190.1 conserved hypothetical protein [Paraburkholderia unamae]
MPNLPQLAHHFVIVANEFGRLFVPVTRAVRPGEYALREPSVEVTVGREPLEWDIEPPRYFGGVVTEMRLGSLSNRDDVSGESSGNAGFEFEDRYGLAEVRQGSAFATSGLGAIWERWIAKVQRAPRRQALARAWRVQEPSRVRRYMLVEGLLVSAGRLAKDYLLETLRELSASHRDLASKRALARVAHMHVRPTSGPAAETGSAAAIAKRMNPLGAPPHLV